MVDASKLSDVQSTCFVGVWTSVVMKLVESFELGHGGRHSNFRSNRVQIQNFAYFNLSYRNFFFFRPDLVARCKSWARCCHLGLALS